VAEDLEALEPWLQGYLDRLAPAQRRKAAQAIGQQARRANALRIAANVEPDGAAMAPRKQKKRLADRHGKVRRTAKMFAKIRLARFLRVQASEDQTEVGFKAGTDSRIASVHQYGQVDSVGRTRRGQVVQTRYAARRLLGFSPEDRQAILDTAIRMVEGS
jgi:phage virion morphogenesis protein